MSTPASILLRIPLLFCFAATLAYAADGEVANPAKRIEAINQAKALLAAKEAAASVKSPFQAEAYNEALALSSGRGVVSPETPVARPTSGPRTDRDLLQAMAANLKPSGFFVIGGEETLVFGQKRVKAGGTLSIRFEDADYTLEIVSIDRPNFTLRLNREEFTRPIK